MAATDPFDLDRLRAAAEGSLANNTALGPVEVRAGHIGRPLVHADDSRGGLLVYASDASGDYAAFAGAWTPEVALALLDEVERIRERLELHRQSSRAMVRRAERAEQERDEARAEVKRLRALALVPMDGPPTEPGWYVVAPGVCVEVWLDDCDNFSRDVALFTWDEQSAYAIPVSRWHSRWLARIPVEALEVSDGE